MIGTKIMSYYPNLKAKGISIIQTSCGHKQFSYK